MQNLQNISEIRTFFRTNEDPIYFFGPTAFNLLGLNRWVRNFNYVSFFDPFEGTHPRVISPTTRTDEVFQSSEAITNYLLRNEEIRTIIKARGVFSEDGRAEIWLTDDDRRLMVQMKSHMKVGSLSLFLRSYTPGKMASADSAAVARQ